jgi:DNA-binding transcriptional regulator/RsmH inhibitor MraZ
MSGEEKANKIGFKTFYSALQATIDDKGRLKIPSEALEKSTDGLKVFITSFDLREIRVYPIHLWEHNLNLLGNASGNAAAAQRLARLARANGVDGVVDPSGRVLLPAALRKGMGFEKEPVPVVVELFDGRLNVVTKKVYEEELAIAAANMAADKAVLEGIGLK